MVPASLYVPSRERNKFRLDVLLQDLPLGVASVLSRQPLAVGSLGELVWDDRAMSVSVYRCEQQTGDLYLVSLVAVHVASGDQQPPVRPRSGFAA
jgi:hypothetical protein